MGIPTGEHHNIFNLIGQGTSNQLCRNCAFIYAGIARINAKTFTLAETSQQAFSNTTVTQGSSDEDSGAEGKAGYCYR